MFEHILVLGPRSKGGRANKSLEELIAIYKSPTQLVISAINDEILTPEQFRILDHQIALNNRIDLFFHGQAFRCHNKGSENLSHYVVVDSKDSDKYIATATLFQLLANKSFGTPLNVYLWSCHGNLSQDDLTYLPLRSIYLNNSYNL